MEPEDAFEIAPRVFFGPANTTYNTHYMRNFTHIVNCDSVSSSTSSAGLLKRFLFLPSYDDEEFQILTTHFTTLLHFIQNALQNPSSKVFIHCYMGWNRSACLAIAYAWSQQSSKSMLQMIEETKKAIKSPILTNDDFVRKLLQFSLEGAHSIGWKPMATAI